MPKVRNATRVGLFQYATLLLILLVGIGQRKNISHLRKLDHLIRQDIAEVDVVLTINEQQLNQTYSDHQRHQNQNQRQNDAVVNNRSSFTLQHQQTTTNSTEEHSLSSFNSSPLIAAAPVTNTPPPTNLPPTQSPIEKPAVILSTNLPETASSTHSPDTASPTDPPVTSSPSASPTTLPVKAVETSTPATQHSATVSLIQQQQQPPPPPRFFMGIFTSIKGHRRRQVIRQALKLYNDSRVCSFGAFDRQSPLQLPTLDDNCQLIYTFVVASSPDGPAEVVRKDRNLPLLSTLPEEYKAEADEFNDITFLRIHEQPNNQGKAPTWLNFASQIAKKNDWDYVVKCDAKTFLHVDAFFSFNHHHDDSHYQQPWPRGAHNLYSGLIQWSYPDSHIYMNGAFYLLSRDLADSVVRLSTGERQGRSGSRKRKDIAEEDIDTGFAVMMNHELVQVVALPTVDAETLWKYPLLTFEEMEQYAKTVADRLVGISNHTESISLISS